MESEEKRRCLCCLIFKKLIDYDYNRLGKLERYCKLCVCIPPMR